MSRRCAPASIFDSLLMTETQPHQTVVVVLDPAVVCTDTKSHVAGESRLLLSIHECFECCEYVQFRYATVQERAHVFVHLHVYAAGGLISLKELTYSRS